MLNFRSIIGAAAETAGDRPVVAAAYPLNRLLCRELAADGLVSGYVEDHTPELTEPEPWVAGWWVNRTSGQWFLRQTASPTMLLLSGAAHHQLGGGSLLEARLKGIRRILYVGDDGTIVKQIDVVAELTRLLSSIVPADRIYQVGYDQVFEDIYDTTGTRLRLVPAAFVPGRVLLLIDSLQAGGAQRQAAYTAAGLAARFPGQVFLGCSEGGGIHDFYKPYVLAAGLQIRLIPQSLNLGGVSDLADAYAFSRRSDALGSANIYRQILQYALLIAQLRPEVVHTWMDYSNTLGGIAADLIGVPRLVMGGRSLAPDNFTIFEPYMAAGYRALLKRREPVLLNNSQAGTRDYGRWLGLPTDRFRVIPNGYEPPPTGPTARTKVREDIGIPPDAVVVGSIFVFREEKRPLLWLEMACVLHRSHPELRFVIYGDGALLPDARALAEKHGLSSVVIMPGVTSDAWSALSAMDIFVLTSRMEGLPNVMIEAQLMGIPVVCTGTGGMYETFVENETGLGVRNGTPEALAEAVALLVDDPERRHRMGEAARQHARAAFSIERMIDETVDAYRSGKDHSSNFPPDWKEITPQDYLPLGGIMRAGEHRFVAELPQDTDFSGFCLWEDDNALVRTEAIDTNSLAGGRFCISGYRVFFSTADGSDPRFSGRSYRLRLQSPGFDEIVIDPAVVQPEIGYCFVVDLPLGEGAAQFKLLENGTRLGPGSSLHDVIRVTGCGRYSVWGEHLYFSASDNTDPRTNGHRYVLRRERVGHASFDGLPGSEQLSQEEAFFRLLSNTCARPDFVARRIVNVTGSLGPGGAERQIVYTLAELRKRRIESVQLLSYFLDPTAEDQHDFYLPALNSAGVPVRNIRRHVGGIQVERLPVSLRAVYQALPEQLVADIADLYWEFIELRPEVVHSWLDNANDRAALAAALAGVPRIVIAGRNVNPTHFGFYQPHMQAAFQALLQLPRVTMINNSIAGRDDYAAWLGIEPERIPVVYNAIEFAERAVPSIADSSKLRECYGLRPQAFVIGGVFRLAPEKRPLLWVEAAAEIAQRLPEAQFIVFGDGDMRDQIERRVMALGLQDRFVFGGRTTAILDAIAMMDLFMLASSFEGIPNVVLEAQWVGTPVIATRAGGTPEAVEEGVTGWITDPPTPKALADRAVALHDDPQARRRARERGRGFVKERFGLARMIGETLRIYGMGGGPSA